MSCDAEPSMKAAWGADLVASRLPPPPPPPAPALPLPTPSIREGDLVSRTRVAAALFLNRERALRQRSRQGVGCRLRPARDGLELPAGLSSS